jgi:hypothetical chaperone protein
MTHENEPPARGGTLVGVGVDFGTTNSAVALAYADGSVDSVVWPSLEAPTATYRTALAFWREGRRVAHVAGPQAIERAADPPGEQRFIQSLKTHLASPLFSDTRLYGQRFTIEQLVAIFLRHLLEEGEVTAGAAMLGGRPVVFAGASADEKLACTRLQTAFAQAGRAGVDLAYEPLGAAYWYARALDRDETVLVADFGGGTSDFSLLRFSRGGGRLVAEPLAHSGVGVAGDTFDYRIVDHAVAPLLGKGATYRSFDKILPIPAYFHAAFSHWHQLSWLKSAETLNTLRKFASSSDRTIELGTLIDVIEMDMGFALYRAVGLVKAQLSSEEHARLQFAPANIDIEIARADFENWIVPDLAAMDDAIDRALTSAGMTEASVDAVFLTGGTSYVPAVRRLFSRRFAADRILQGDAFQSVASGLALLAADRAAQV